MSDEPTTGQTPAMLAKSDRKLNGARVGKNEPPGDLSAKPGESENGLADFETVEDAIRPHAARLFRELGYDVLETHKYVSVERNGEAADYDLLFLSDREVIACDCMRELRVEFVEYHLDRLEKFRRLMPRYAGMRVFGAVAAMAAPADAAAFAAKQGLFVIRQSGDSVELANGPDFSPKEF